MPRRLPQPEFIALCAMMFAMIALSIDAMLPALPEIAADLAEGDTESAALIVSFFVLGMGLGTMFTGPLSDRFGRKPVLLAGIGIYAISAVICMVSQSLEVLLFARFLQGVGASGPRIVALAIIRDLYSGPYMARIMSFVMVVFTLLPAVGPLFGALILQYSGWRAIFGMILAFAIVASLWVALRQSETLSRSKRVPFRVSVLIGTLREMCVHPTVRLSMIVQVMGYGMLFTIISLTQQVFDQVFDEAHSFPYWFGAIAVVAGTGGYINAKLVVALGPARLVTFALGAQAICSMLVLMAALSGMPAYIMFPVFLIWQTTLFFQNGLTIANLNSMAMQPMGHVAGMAASVIGSLSAIGAIILSVPVIFFFDGTIVPMALGIGAMATVGYIFMWSAAKNGVVET